MTRICSRSTGASSNGTHIASVKTCANPWITHLRKLNELLDISKENNMTQDTIKTRLQAARALIDQPEKWTQGALNRDARGNSVVFASPDVEVLSCCAYGAIMNACMGCEYFEIACYLLKSINRHWTERSAYYFRLTSWNDAGCRTHAEVMQAFDRAIEDAQ